MGALADLRGEVQAALDRAATGEPWSVYPLGIESPTPPCYVLIWADPWLEGPVTPCLYRARLDVRVISKRIEPDTGIELLEAMIEAAAAELEKARRPIRNVTRPRGYTINNVVYQSALLQLTHNIAVVNGGN